MLNYSLVVAVFGICAWHTHGTSPISCDEPNTEYNSCKNNCTDECQTNPPHDCPMDCYEGCFCKPNFKRINGECVPEANCNSCTGKNEVYSDCTSLCTDNCPSYTPTMCINAAAACLKGCSCIANYRRHPETGQCIPIEQCKVKCTKNSTFKCICDDSCKKGQIVCKRCTYTCACDVGFSRINGTCQPEGLCPN